MKSLAKLTPLATALLLSLGTASAQADDKLSVSGFIDMSYLAIDVDGGHRLHQ